MVRPYESTNGVFYFQDVAQRKEDMSDQLATEDLRNKAQAAIGKIRNCETFDEVMQYRDDVIGAIDLLAAVERAIVAKVDRLGEPRNDVPLVENPPPNIVELQEELNYKHMRYAENQWKLGLATTKQIDYIVGLGKKNPVLLAKLADFFQGFYTDATFPDSLTRGQASFCIEKFLSNKFDHVIGSSRNL